MEESHLT